MYTKGTTFKKFGYSFTEILDPDGDVVCTLRTEEADGLLSHLNRN